MKNLQFFTCNLLILILESFNLGFDHKAEASRGNVIPLGSMFDSSERRHFKDIHMNEHSHDSFENLKTDFPEFRKRKLKKKHRTAKNKNSLVQNSGTEKKHEKKKSKKRGGKRFVKTILKDIEKDSNLSDSEEKDKKNNPVDIIVHIKMKD